MNSLKFILDNTVFLSGILLTVILVLYAILYRFKPNKSRSRIKLVPVVVIIAVCFLGVIDGIMANYSEEKHIELVQGNSVIKGNFTEGILTYRSSNLYFFKWEIDSIKEISEDY